PRRSSSDSWLLFCRQFLKTRIVPDLIPDRIESQQRRSNRKGIRYPQQPLEDGNRVIGIPQQSVDLRHALLFGGALEWIFGSGMHGHSVLAVGGPRIREYLYGRGVMALEQSLHTTVER